MWFLFTLLWWYCWTVETVNNVKRMIESFVSYDFIKHYTYILMCNYIMLVWKPQKTLLWTLTISLFFCFFQRKILWQKHPRLWSQLKKEWKMTFLNLNPPLPPRTFPGLPEKTCKMYFITSWSSDFCVSFHVLKKKKNVKLIEQEKNSDSPSYCTVRSRDVRGDLVLQI